MSTASFLCWMFFAIGGGTLIACLTMHWAFGICGQWLSYRLRNQLFRNIIYQVRVGREWLCHQSTRLDSVCDSSWGAHRACKGLYSLVNVLDVFGIWMAWDPPNCLGTARATSCSAPSTRIVMVVMAVSKIRL